ncbi:MAG: helix-turn-helix domain-containing protein [Pigmentiphaga sp.]
MSKLPTRFEDGAQALFAANVRRVRRDKGLTQERLAEAADLHPNYISSVERGERNISIRNIERIAFALDVSMAYLLTPPEQAADAASAALTTDS